jgi:uncharacterized membrane protein
MRVLWRNLFTSKVEAGVRWDRWDSMALVVGVLIVIWVFALKLKAFYDLSYSSDLFDFVQLARSWLEGRGLLQDNCYGNFLAIHSCFLLLPLGLIAKPFGAPGLLFVLAASAGAAYFWATRILRLFGVDGRVAAIAAGVVLMSPLSVLFYQETFYGFEVENLVPALCLMLFYFLLQRRMIASIVTAIAVISVKEDAPIAGAMVAIVAGVETWISSPGDSARSRFNWPAAITLILSVSAIPVLLTISWLQTPTMYARHSVDRLGMVAPGSLSGPGALFIFVASNVGHWLDSNVVRQWLWVFIVGSFGTVFLRPYYLVIGIPTTLVAWLRNQNELLWAPRFFPTEAMLWCVILLGFASIARTVSHCSKRTRTAVLTTAIVITALAAAAQLALVPWCARRAYLLRSTSFYSSSDLLHSTSFYSSSERQEADALFARYRREGKPGDPVIASSMLFRYAHDRNLFWLTRLHGRPVPIWILGDAADPYVPFRISTDTINADSGIQLEDYALIDRRGRFVLLRKRP